MLIVERWVNVCGGADLDATPLVKKEMKDFLGKMASLGSEYRAWSHRIRDKLKLEVSYLSNNTPEHFVRFSVFFYLSYILLQLLAVEHVRHILRVNCI